MPLSCDGVARTPLDGSVIDDANNVVSGAAESVGDPDRDGLAFGVIFIGAEDEDVSGTKVNLIEGPPVLVARGRRSASSGSFTMTRYANAFRSTPCGAF